MSLHDALGGMREIAQWFLWRLEWSPEEGKYLKTPCALDGSNLQRGEDKQLVGYNHASAQWRQLQLGCPADRTLQYALGFWLTEDCGYWFFDLDKCAVDGVVSEFAGGLVACFPGALVEWSSSGKGLHVIGRGRAPPHRCKPPRNIKQGMLPLELEFYTEGRGIAFGLSGEAQGSADTEHDAMVAKLCELYFPPRQMGEPGDGARPEWRGPADDDVLLQRALNARQSAESAFGGKPSFARLWAGLDVEKNSENDMALASHLAFWTGCDEERVLRLMLRSGLVREKWSDHRPGGTYLTFTIANACRSTTTVYQEPERSQATAMALYGARGSLATVTQVAGGVVITPEMKAQVADLLDAVSACGTIEDMHNLVVPRIQGAGVPGVYQEQLVRAVNAQLDIWHAKLPVGKLRSLLFPPAMVDGNAADVPLWCQQHCYVKDGDFFYDTSNGARLTYQGFQAEYSRLMPLRQGGGRENPVEWAFTRWNITTVHHLGYRPDMPSYFTWDGLEYANLYSPSSVPATATEWTPEGVAGVQALQAMLWDMCGRREDVYLALLGWLAHNVQKPGIKIRWSPIIKGCPGDAKTIVTNVLRAVMGYRNVSVTGNATLRAQGGFNDWAVGGAVNVIEEIMLTGKERYTLFNAMLEFITNDVVNINAKGGKTYKTWNVTNHMANTNHNDALPLPALDRRWMVVFTPWESLPDMYAYCGLSEDAWKQRTKAVDFAWKNRASELRAWFLSLQIAIDADGSALMTPEKMQMMASSQEDAESVAEGIIADGATGITSKVISSSCLSQMLKMRAMTEGFEVPKTTSLNHMLTRLGYSKLPKQIKWRDSTHTVWVKNGFSGDIRFELDNSKPTSNPTSNPH
jgi:hypothetical protein